MPAARGVKRVASKSSAATASTGPKNKKKRGPIQLEIPVAPKKRGRVLTCGQGDVGQLGLGDDIQETTKFKYVTALGDKIVDVHAGGMHTIALDSSGKVWTFGCNDEGALGRPTSGDRDEGSPGSVPLAERAVAIAAGDSHSAALLHNGDVYAWGAFRDSHGSMGLVMRGREGKSCREPVKLELPEPAVDLASGGDHLVVLTTSGSVYTMGCGEQGQLGRLAQRSATRDARQGFSALLVPSKVTLKMGASRVWAGYHATFVLDANKDKMFAWGLNNYGQLGITGEKRKTALFSPTECDAFTARSDAWGSVAAGQHHSLALDSTGHVYAIGRCEYGRLGLGDRAGDAEALEPVPKLVNKKCVSISAGTSNSFAVTDSGEVLSWGMGSEGQLGTGQCSDANEPTPAVCAAFQDRLPLAVSAGGQHTVLLVEDPTSQKDPSPTPDKETEEEKMEDTEDEQKEIEETKQEKPRGKRQKKEQEGEISSTSSAQADNVTDDNKPEKVNGDDKKDTPMEIDETDNTETKQDNTDEIKTAIEQTDETQHEQQTTDEELKIETTDTSSQDTTDSEHNKPHETGAAEPDVDMEKPEVVNGTPETEVIEPKIVEASIKPSINPLTTTA